MKYLENAIKFITKHYILAVPLLISAALTSLLGGSTSGVLGKIWNVVPTLNYGADIIKNPNVIFRVLSTAVVASGLGFFSIILTLIVTPATYGMIYKVLKEGIATLNDFVPQFKNNIAKYLIFWVGNVVVWIVLGVIAMIIGLISVIISSIFKWLGVLFFFLMLIVLFVAIVYISINLSLWFPTMMIENLDVVAAFKKSFFMVKNNFWMILGISLLVSIVSSLANSVLSILGKIPLLGPIILSVIPAASSFIMMVFFLMYYSGEKEI